jgi:hypothetical protein
MVTGQIHWEKFFFFQKKLGKVAQPYTKCLFFSNIWLKIRDNTYNTLYLPVNSWCIVGVWLRYSLVYYVNKKKI